jgi:hypothetical protein
MIVARDCRYAALSISSIAVLIAVMILSLNTEASARRGRPQAQDHRHPNIGGQAIPGGPRIKCVLPFCGHSFNPQGRRPQVQDHRPGANVPPNPNRPRQTSNSATNAACLANRTCVQIPRSSGPHGGGRPGVPSPQRPPVVPSN